MEREKRRLMPINETFVPRRLCSHIKPVPATEIKKVEKSPRKTLVKI
jgi:hypothetical protein